MKKILLIFFFIFIFFEIYIRVHSPTIHETDKQVGWRLKSNLDLKIKQKDLVGKNYDVHFLTNENGARFYGKIINANLKILIIGDSFTNMPYASNDKMWFSVFADKLKDKTNKNIYVEAIGAGGYGNLQQLFLLEESYKDFNPDFVIFQMCNNDFMDNTFEWMVKNHNRNQFLRSPYLKDDMIFYDKSLLSKFYKSIFFENIRLISRIDLFVSLSLYKIYYQLYGEISLDVDEKIKDDSIKITNNIFNKIKKIFNDTDVFIINCSQDNRYPFNQWQKIALNNRMIPINIFDSFNYSNEVFYKDGGHFNDLGNLQVGEILSDEINKIYDFN